MKSKLLFCLYLFLSSLTSVGGNFIPSWKEVEGYPNLINELGEYKIKELKPQIDHAFYKFIDDQPSVPIKDLLKIESADAYNIDDEKIYEVYLEWNSDRCGIFKEDYDLEYYLANILKVLDQNKDEKLSVFITFYPQAGYFFKLHNRIKGTERIRTVTLFPSGLIQLSERENQDSIFETIYEDSIQIVDR